MNKLSTFFAFCFVLVVCSCSSTKEATKSKEVVKDQTEENITLSLADRLRKVSGVSVSGSGADTFVTIRGTTSIVGSSEPLFVVDGVAIGGGFAAVNQMVNVEEIKSIRALKSSAQTAIYGARGANGVIKITMKKQN